MKIQILSHKFAGDICTILSSRFNREDDLSFSPVDTFDYNFTVERMLAEQTDEKLNLVVIANFAIPQELINTQFLINKQESNKIKVLFIGFSDFVIDNKLVKNIHHVDIGDSGDTEMFQRANDEIKKVFIND